MLTSFPVVSEVALEHWGISCLMLAIRTVDEVYCKKQEGLLQILLEFTMHRGGSGGSASIV